MTLTKDAFMVRTWRDNFSTGWGYEVSIGGVVVEFGWSISDATAEDEAERAIARYIRQYAERPV